jgi:sucrose-6-phosphate hydrolase SacC (GH32 family)
MNNHKKLLTALIALSLAGGLAGCKLGEVGPDAKKPVTETPTVPQGKLEFQLAYNEANGTATTPEKVTGASLAILNQFNKPERVAGIEGNALRTDGFSTYLSAPLTLANTQTLTVSTWAALESYPSDAEVPYDQQKPSALVSQFADGKGFTLDINTWGEYSFKVNVGGTMVNVKAPELFPLYTWTHIAGVVDATKGKVTLYRDGVAVASTDITKGKEVQVATAPVIVGKSHTDKIDGIFLLNGLNGAFDETRIYSQALAASELLSQFNAGAASAQSTGLQATATPATRFANDHLRPIFHAMPPANWTNEPHGLVRRGDKLHMFYQRTPNGPYKTQMHWGHMVSSDFVHWQNQPDALYPTLQANSTAGFDMKGIWAGDVVVKDNKAYAFYTNVNHAGPFNPGIALATSDDANLTNWTKVGAVIDHDKVEDFRDPYLWEENGTWHMLIGAKLAGKGGVVHYTSTNLHNWTYQPNFSTASFSSMDVGSAVWELPIFEPIGNGKHILLVNPVGGAVGKYDPTNPTRGLYWIGTWANGKFTPDYTEPKKLDLVRGHLSPTVERNAQGVLTGIGIVDERRNGDAQKAAGWTHTFGLPREWFLLPDNATLGQRPSGDIASLRTNPTASVINNLTTDGVTYSGVSGSRNEFILKLASTNAATRYGFEVLANEDGSEYTRIYYDAVTKRIVLDKRNSTLSNQDEEKTLLVEDYDEAAFGMPTQFHVYIDGSVVDVFVNEKAAFSFRAYPTKTTSNRINVYANQGTANFESLEHWELKSISAP